MIEDHYQALMAPLHGENVIGMMVTRASYMVIHQIQDLAEAHNLDIIVFRNRANDRTIVYDANTNKEMWVIQERRRK